MRRREFISLGAVVATSGLAGCSTGTGERRNTVDMTDDLRFEPRTLTIRAGDTVTWINAGTIVHTVTAYEADLPEGGRYFASGGFTSESVARQNLEPGLIDADDQYQHIFKTTGTFDYFCIPHEGSGMVGSIQVQ